MVNVVTPIKFRVENIVSHIRSFIGVVLVLFTAVDRGYCGGGPETTLLVVNGDSPLSLTVANEYVSLRNIPQSHVVWLYGLPSLTEITVDTFRTRIWEPIHDFMIEHDLQEEIDAIAYSADFPYAVNIDSDLKYYGVKLKPPFSRMASLTGLTFYARHVANRSIRFLSAKSNQYFRYDPSAPGSFPSNRTEEEKRILIEGNSAFNNAEYKKAQQAFMIYTNQRPEHGAGWYKLALIYARQGKRDKALDALSEAANAGYSHILRIETEKAWQTYREDPRFTAAVAKMWETDVGLLPPLGFKHTDYSLAKSLPIHSSSRRILMNRYYLSTMLAYTSERGNNLREIFAYLGAAAANDGSHPEGTVYLMNNRNVRSTTRQPLFPATVTALRRAGHKVEILGSKQQGQDGLMPLNKNDVIGIVAGTANFNWRKTKSRLIPGAIAESLTSFGAKFSSPKQTKLTEFLRYGAAGSSGTVAEPYAVQEKFPVPFLHVYYAAGCSLAEAFYQSVATPYQLLVMGDPLARPFADFAEIHLDTAEKSAVKGVKSYVPKIAPAAGHETGNIELWVDGQLLGIAKSGDPLTWNTTVFSDGDHNLRIVAEEAGQIGTRSYFSIWQKVRNGDHQIQIIDFDRHVRLDQTITIRGRAERAKKIEVRQGTRILKALALNSADWKTKINANRLGMGRVQLSVRASYPDGSSYINSPLDIEIGLPTLLKSQALSQQDDNELALRVADSQSEIQRLMVISEKARLDLKTAARDQNINGSIQKASINGRFLIENSGFYQLDIKTDGKISVAIDKHMSLPATRPSRGKLLFIPVNLQKGWHDLAIDFHHGETTHFKVQIAGASVAQTLIDENLRNSPLKTQSAKGR